MCSLHILGDKPGVVNLEPRPYPVLDVQNRFCSGEKGEGRRGGERGCRLQWMILDRAAKPRAYTCAPGSGSSSGREPQRSTGRALGADRGEEKK